MTLFNGERGKCSKPFPPQCVSQDPREDKKSLDLFFSAVSYLLCDNTELKHCHMLDLIETAPIEVIPPTKGLQALAGRLLYEEVRAQKNLSVISGSRGE